VEKGTEVRDRDGGSSDGERVFVTKGCKLLGVVRIWMWLTWKSEGTSRTRRGRLCLSLRGGDEVFGAYSQLLEVIFT